MHDAEFKTWLQKSGAKSLAGQNTRVQAIKTIEKQLAALGSPHTDLAAAYAHDKFAQLRDKFRQIIKGVKTGSTDYQILMPKSENPLNRLANWNSWLAQYGRFLDGRDPNFDAANDDPDHELIDDTSGLGLTKEAVEATMHAYDQDATAFMKKYSFAPNYDYVVLRPGQPKYYPAKAIFLVAFSSMPGNEDITPPDKRNRFSDGKDGPIHLEFRRLGYEAKYRRQPDSSTGESSEPESHNGKGVKSMAPTNLILYGPPGTGKTYNTALEAVKLCDGTADFASTVEGRAALMARYNELVGEERISFVTFHQNYGYEDFVEGLRPVTFGEDGEPLGSGFRLAPEAGIFTKIAERARALADTGKSGYDFSGKRFFKMSLGVVANSDEDYVFDEAVEGGFIHMGDEGAMDWSDPRFSTKAEMIAGYAARYPERARLHPNNGIIEFPFQMKVRARVGDIVIITRGNLLLRAIGEITGEFCHVERKNDNFTMRRDVRWLWVDPDGLSYDVINARRFSQRTIYELSEAGLKLNALRGLVEAGLGHTPAGPARPFVLIIDEINRANVSKVFGELITLIEPDKRHGMENGLAVTLPYSRRPFSVPANLHIIGTMNTADRSIALLDTALRRRFIFREMAPQPGLLKVVDGINLPAVLTTINQRIEYLLDREHRIGHAFFLGCTTRQDIEAVMRDRIIPLLQEYFFEDWSRVAAVVGKGFIGSSTLKCPLGEGEDRKSWFVLSPFTAEAFKTLTGQVPDNSSVIDSET